MCRPTFLVKALSKVRQTCAERQWDPEEAHLTEVGAGGGVFRNDNGTGPRSSRPAPAPGPRSRPVPRGPAPRPSHGRRPPVAHHASARPRHRAPALFHPVWPRPVPAGRPDLPLRRPGPGQLLRVRAVRHTGGRQRVRAFRETPPGTLPGAGQDHTRALLPRRLRCRDSNSPAVPTGAARPAPRRFPSVPRHTESVFPVFGPLITAPHRRIRRPCQLVVVKTFRRGREGKTGPSGKDLTEPTGQPRNTSVSSVSSDTLRPCRRRARVPAGLRHDDGTGNIK